MISFNRPTVLGNEIHYITEVISKQKLCGDGEFTKKCNDWFLKNVTEGKSFLTTSCSSSLDMTAFLCDIKPGDEVIMPSFTFVSTANAFVQRGAKIIFVDVRPETMNIDEDLILDAITAKTKAIVPVHYAGISCDMDRIMEIAKEKKLFVVEDAAQAILSSYKNTPLGSIGHFGCLSFHETKNINCGEGGALLVNDDKYWERAEIIREKGTDRSKFIRGQVDKYTWVDIGSSYLPSELNAAFLYAQLEHAQSIISTRIAIYELYKKLLTPLADDGKIELPVVPAYNKHNAHIFFIKCSNINERQALIDHLMKNEISSVFHYIPLHSSKAGIAYGRFHGEDKYTTIESERLLRLPLYHGIKAREIEFIVDCIGDFYS